ncbi:MAG: hypothetical protein AABY22_05470, partial [Nanoarchaeota archaeon]
KLQQKVIGLNNKVFGLGRYFKDYKKCLYNNKKLENYNKKYSEAGAAKAYAFLNEFLQKGQSLHHFDIAGIMNKQVENPNYGLKEMIEIVKEIK